MCNVAHPWFIRLTQFHTVAENRHNNVLDVRLNLISARWLDDEGYSGSFHNGTWKFSKGSLIVARAQTQNTMYVMHVRLCRDEANVVADSDGELWHKRLCHMSERGMHILSKRISYQK